MANTYTWKIEALDCIPQSGGQTNVVKTVHWRLVGTVDSYVASRCGALSVAPYEEGNPFTAYSDLTSEQVVGWVTEALGAEEIASLEEAIAEQLSALSNPPVVSPDLPW
jgi:hypothetical protein